MREATGSHPATNESMANAAGMQAQSLVHHLSVIDPRAALISRVLCNTHAEMFLSGLPGIEGWNFEASPDDADADAEDPGLITLGSIAGPLHLSVDLAAYPALQILAHIAEATPAAKLRNAIANSLLGSLIEQMNSAGVGTWRVTAIERGRGERLADLKLASLGRVHRVGIDAPPGTLMVFEQRLETLAQESVDGAGAAVSFPSLPIPGRVAIGRRSLPVAALQKLEPGDILLRVLPVATVAALQSDNITPFRTHAAWGTPGMSRVTATVSIEGTTLTIIEEPFMTDDPAQADGDQAPFEDGLPDREDQPEDACEADESDEADPGDNAQDRYARAVPIGELELPVQFEIDTITLPLAQVSALRPGYIIELQAPVRDARIRLVTHGQTIGHGELVALGEHLGIRILRMAHGDGSVQ
jgi:type III secretion protein Q